MRLFVRYLLWLLIAALPLQGGAAAFMSCDASARQIGAAVHGVSDHDDDASGRPSAAMHGHCGTGDQDHPAGAHGKCSQCASCCIGAAAPPAMRAGVPVARFRGSVVMTVEPAMTVYYPAALERPPRHAQQ